MMARSRKIDGTYEFCPRNPIISHRHLSLEHEISVTGHADIVKTQNDEWWMVLLAVRPYKHAHFNLDVRICHMILESPNFIVITLNALS